MKLLIPILMIFHQIAFAGVGGLKENKFRITGYVSGAVSALSPDEAKEKLEKGLTITLDKYIAHGINIQDPKYKIKRIESEMDFFDDFRISYKRLKADSEIVSICSVQTSEGKTLEGYGSKFIILSDRRIAILWDGLFIIYE